MNLDELLKLLKEFPKPESQDALEELLWDLKDKVELDAEKIFNDYCKKISVFGGKDKLKVIEYPCKTSYYAHIPISNGIVLEISQRKKYYSSECEYEVALYTEERVKPIVNGLVTIMSAWNRYEYDGSDDEHQF